MVEVVSEVLYGQAMATVALSLLLLPAEQDIELSNPSMSACMLSYFLP